MQAVYGRETAPVGRSFFNHFSVNKLPRIRLTDLTVIVNEKKRVFRSLPVRNLHIERGLTGFKFPSLQMGFELGKTRSLYASWVCGILLALTVAPGAAEASTSGVSAGAGGADLANAVTQELITVFRSQRPDGSLAFPGPHSLFADYPLLATLALDIQRQYPSRSLVSQSAASTTRYYSYLFTEHDHNANLLIETDLVYPDGTRLTGIEQPGFNALLSLDMINLARLNLEMLKPMQALYWYEGARTLQERLIDRCYDADANFFFPFDTNRGAQLHDYYAMSIAPLIFDGNVGDNHASRIISHYVTGAANVSPQPPSAFLYGPAPEGDPLFRPDLLATALVVAKTLDATGYHEEAKRAADNTIGAIAWGSPDSPSPGRQPTATARYLASLLSESRYVEAFDQNAAVDIFYAVVRFKRRMADNEIVRLDQSIRTIKALSKTMNYERARAADIDIESVEAAIRDVYNAVSKTRQQTAGNTLFDREDSYRTSGLRLGPAMSRLLDDVVFALRRAENDVYRVLSERSGLKIAATLMSERALIDQKVEVRWTITARGPQPVELRSASVIRGQEIDSLLQSGQTVVIRPGQPHTLISRFTARPVKVESLLPWDLTLSLTDGTGRRVKYTAFRSIYLEHPIDITASFPEGQILRGLSVPIDIRLVKRTGARIDIDGGWFSPAGLQLKEGNRFGVAMDPAQDTLQVRVNVLVPSPCRPGSFAFKLKFYGNGKDLGLISSNFFKPYQWLFLGPFPASDNPISTPYPPEKSVDLGRGYAGIGKRIAWRVLPESANLNYGDVHLWGSLNPAGVGYLYTVIESSLEKLQCPAYLASDSPAALFINGERVLDFRPGPDRIPATTKIRIRRGMNNIMIKVAGEQTSRIFFKLGDDDNLASDEFNNNLWQLVGNFGEFEERTRRIEAGETEDVQKLVTLRYSDSGAHSVSVIGTFNGWSPEHSRMRRAPNGSWEITLSLRPGKYAYRFLINDRQQVLDPHCTTEEPDGYGGKNSVIYITTSDH